MKITLTQKEVEDIVLTAIKNKVADEFNDIFFALYRSEEFATIRYVEPTFEESNK